MLVPVPAVDALIAAFHRTLLVSGTYIFLWWSTVGPTSLFTTLNLPQSVALPPWSRMCQGFVVFLYYPYKGPNWKYCFKWNYKKILCVSQPGQQQHENDYVDEGEQQWGTCFSFSTETVSTSSWSLNSLAQLWSNLTFEFWQVNSLQIRCLPSMSVCLSLNVSLVACLSQTKISMVNSQHSLFSFTNISICACLIHLCCALIPGYNLFSGGNLWESRKVGYTLNYCFDFSNKFEVFLSFKWTFSCSLFSSPGEQRSSVVVRCFTEALPENRYPVLIRYISAQGQFKGPAGAFDLHFSRLILSLLLGSVGFFTNTCLKKRKSLPSHLSWI